MRGDEAIGGFFEDLPVLAFVLAGTLSVAGTASWTMGFVSQDAEADSMRSLAVRLLGEAVLELKGEASIPLVETIRCEDLHEVLAQADESFVCAISVWCLHPLVEPILAVSEDEGEPCMSVSARSYINAICQGGMIGVLEVRASVWAG